MPLFFTGVYNNVAIERPARLELVRALKAVQQQPLRLADAWQALRESHNGHGGQTRKVNSLLGFVTLKKLQSVEVAENQILGRLDWF